MRGARLFVFSVALLLILLLEGGRIYYVISAAAISISLALYMVRPPSFLRLVMFWQVGFLWIVCREGFFFYSDIISQVGGPLYGTASKYLNAANALVLIGHGLMSREPAMPVLQKWGHYRPPVRSLPILMLVVLYVSSMVVMLPKAIVASAEGRAVVLAQSGGEILVERMLFALMDTVMMAVPALIAFVFVHMLPRARARALVTFAVCLPIFAVQFAMGTRYTLLFSFTSMMIVLMSQQRFSARVLTKLAAAGVVLFVAASLTSAVRDVGLRNATTRIVDTYVNRSAALHTEGVVKVMAQIVDHFERTPHMYGRSSSLLLLFWVPRDFWPDKPTLLGYWFIREYSPHVNWNPMLSVSYTFAGDGYADFGFAGGLVLMLVLGLAFGRLETMTSKRIQVPGHPAIPFIASLFPASLFAVRSLNTATILLIGIGVVTSLFSLMMSRYRVAPSEPVLASPDRASWQLTGGDLERAGSAMPGNE